MKKKKKLHWENKGFSDKSGRWIEATIPELDWTYTVEESQTPPKKAPKKTGYQATVLLGETGEKSKTLHQAPKTLKKAKKACQTHIQKILKKLKKYK